MRGDGENLVGVALDPKVEAATFIDAGLPKVLCLAVFLGSERWMSKIASALARNLPGVLAKNVPLVFFSGPPPTA